MKSRSIGNQTIALTKDYYRSALKVKNFLQALS